MTMVNGAMHRVVIVSVRMVDGIGDFTFWSVGHRKKDR
jgi:hypothetical protein